MDWIALVIGQPKDVKDSSDPVNLAEDYLYARSLHGGTSSTLRKVMRARRIALGDRPAVDREPKTTLRPLPPARRPPRGMSSRIVMRIVNDDRGQGKPEPYLLVTDNSRYTGEKLKELRRSRR